jgi:hypothetical protein
LQNLSDGTHKTKRTLSPWRPKLWMMIPQDKGIDSINEDDPQDQYASFSFVVYS